MIAWLKKRWAPVIAAFGLMMVATAAYAMSVQPIIIDLLPAGRHMSAIITVENLFQKPLPVELRPIVAEIQEDGTLRATEQATDDLLVFPPQAVIQPGQTQSFRVQYVGEPDLQTSRHYMVTVAQLPVAFPEGVSAVQVLYNFQVVVNVGVVGVEPDIHVVSAGVEEVDGQPHAVLLLQNNSRTYGYLAAGSLRIVQRDATGKEIFRVNLNSEEIKQQIGYGMVGANRQRRLVTPIILPQAGGTVEAQFTP